MGSTGIEAKVEALKAERKATYRKYTDGKISLEENMAVKDRVGQELAGLEEEIVRINAQKMDYYRMVQALEQLVMANDETVENFRRIVETVYVNGDEMKVELKADQWLNRQ
jgi:flagellar biosynthesis chaperone FliJ